MDMTAPNPHYDPCPYEAEERRLEPHVADWRRRFMAGDAAGDLACGLPQCDGDAWEAVAMLIRSGLQQPWSCDDRKRAEDVLTALAKVEADREAQQ